MLTNFTSFCDFSVSDFRAGSIKIGRECRLEFRGRFYDFFLYSDCEGAVLSSILSSWRIEVKI